MWAHRPWIGTFFPSATPQASLLASYTSSFDTVEGNTTFYALPPASTVERWADQTPSHFRFVLKVPRRITHELRLRDARPELLEFVSRFEPLADRLGPTFLQLPPSFGPGDLPALRDFLTILTPERQWAVEVRHRDFFVGGRLERPLDELLREHGVNRVIMDARCVHAGPSDTEHERDEIRSKPNLPVRPVATADHPIVRFIGQTAPDANPPFWEPWVGACTRWVQRGLQPYFFVHTPDNLATPHLAVRFREQVASRLAAAPPTGA
jgi:uncharacterized protein YecE (DUF72 family)